MTVEDYTESSGYFYSQSKDAMGTLPEISWQKMEIDTSPRRSFPSGYWRHVIGFPVVGEGNSFEIIKSKAKAKKFLRQQQNIETWTNDIYRVTVNRKHINPLMEVVGLSVGQVIELGITRRDQSAIHDWRQLQYIKNDILGEEVEAVELFPRESRLLDSANTFWLYAIPNGNDFPFGSTHRAVLDEEEAMQFGAVQRPFNRQFRETTLDDIEGVYNENKR